MDMMLDCGWTSLPLMGFALNLWRAYVERLERSSGLGWDRFPAEYGVLSDPVHGAIAKKAYYFFVNQQILLRPMDMINACVALDAASGIKTDRRTFVNGLRRMNRQKDSTMLEPAA